MSDNTDKRLLDIIEKKKIENDNNRKRYHDKIETPKYKSCLKLVNILETLVKNPIDKDSWNLSWFGDKQYDTTCSELDDFVHRNNINNKHVKFKVIGHPGWNQWNGNYHKVYLDYVTMIYREIDTDNKIITYNLE